MHLDLVALVVMGARHSRGSCLCSLDSQAKYSREARQNLESAVERAFAGGYDGRRRYLVRRTKGTRHASLANDLRPVAEPLTGPATKFGGQPVWLERPAWPVSRPTGKRMVFVGQVALDPALLGEHSAGEVAYFFMTEDEEEYVDGTLGAGGRRARGRDPALGREPPVETREIPTGRTVPLIGPSGAVTDQPSPSFAVSLGRVEDEPSPAANGTDFNLMGGPRQWLQGEGPPPGEGRQFVLSLDSTALPLWVNFGDAGVGYIFVSSDCRQGRCLWQCA
jgi:hypothetical protein